MTEWLLLGAAIVLTLGTALFVAAEFSLVSLDRPAVQRAAESGDRGAQSVLVSLRNLSTQLSAAQVGITVTTLVLGFIAAPSIGSLLMTPLRALGLTGELLAGASSALALVVATVFSMVVGELVPQFLGFSAPMGTARVVAVPVRRFALVVRPLILVLNGSANLFLRRLGIEPQEELSAARTPAELASLVRSSAAAGSLTPSTARILARSIGFDDQSAEDVMTPRSRADAVHRADTASQIIALARETGHSRFPVLGDDWDDVDGVVHVKAAIAVPYERRDDVPASALMTPVAVVPETIRLDPLLLELRKTGYQLALVVDEYGGTSGVVTLEDVVEEIFGDISDEHDRRQSTARKRSDGSWSVPGMWRPDEIRERVGAPVPDDGAYETAGGWIMAALGRIPVVGDEVILPEWTARVLVMDGRRVDRILLAPRAATDPEAIS